MIIKKLTEGILNEDTKEMTLQVLIDEKTNMTDYEEGTYMDVMTKQIQQLFKDDEYN